MPTAEKLDVGLRAKTHQATVINTESVINLTWKQDPRLAESFREFEFFFRKSEQGDKVIPPFRLPTFYATLAVRLAEEWSEAERNIYPVGTDTQGRPELAYSIYRNGREDHIATVFPHAYRNDEIARVYSLEKAEVFCQLLFEAKQREEEGWKVVKPENIYALDPQGKGIVWPDFRQKI